MRSLLVKSLGRTVCVDVPERGRVGALKARIQAAEGIPAHLMRLSCEGRELRDEEIIETAEMPSVVLHFRMLGGKGGFGSLMRAYAAKLAARTRRGDQDVGAMRDLNGRRIRHVETEKKIAEWNAQEKKVDHGSLKKTFKEIQQGKFPTIYKGDCKYGINCKYKWKCRYKHPDDEARAKAHRPVESIKGDFGEGEESNIYEGDNHANIVSAIQKGLKNVRKRVRQEEDKNEDDEELDDVPGDDSQAMPSKRQKAEVKEKEDTKKEDKKPEKAETVDAAPKPKEEEKDFEPVDLKKYKSAKELEALGLGHLKAELMRVGLKCGGNLTQRADRLFLLKTKSYDELPKKVKAKKK